MPVNAGELGGHDKPAESETPFFCLLQDDRLITQTSVATDMLLEPIGSEPDKNDARLVIDANVRPYRVTWGNIGFA